MKRPPALLAPDECGLLPTPSRPFLRITSISIAYSFPEPCLTVFVIPSTRSVVTTEGSLDFARPVGSNPSSFESAQQLLFAVEPRVTGRTCHRHGRREERARRAAERAGEGFGGMCAPARRSCSAYLPASSNAASLDFGCHGNWPCFPDEVLRAASPDPLCLGPLSSPLLKATLS